MGYDNSTLMLTLLLTNIEHFLDIFWTFFGHFLTEIADESTYYTIQSDQKKIQTSTLNGNE